MNLTAEDLLRRSFVITVDESRHDLFSRLFAAHGLEPLPEKFPGVVDENPVAGCLMSHKAAIEEARRRGWPYALVFEDDAYPADRIRRKLDWLLRFVPGHFDVLVLGHSRLKSQSRKVMPLLANYARCYGSHAYVVAQKAYGGFLRWLDDVGKADCFGSPDSPFIDRRGVFASVRPLFIQFNAGRSFHGHAGYIFDIGRKPKDKKRPPKGFSPVERLLGAV